MSRKKKAPKRIFYPDAKYQSTILAKFINFIMYDGKKTTAEKTIYKALDQIRDVTEVEIAERSHHGHHIGKRQHSKNKYK